MTIRPTLAALGLVAALGATAAPAFADSVILFGNDDFGIGLRLDGDRGRHGYDYDRRGRDFGRRDHRDYRLSADDVRRIVHRSGFRRVDYPDYRPRRDVYVVFAENNRGRDVRVVVDARSGDIVNVERLDGGRRGFGRY